MSNKIYVISDPLNESVSRYKVGSHATTKEKLLSRYITSNPEVHIHYFVETPIALEVEAMFKGIHRDKRIRNVRGHLSEWYEMLLADIIASLNCLIAADALLNDEPLNAYRLQNYRYLPGYLDEASPESYANIELITCSEAKTLRRKFKRKVLTIKESQQLDKWFFHTIVLIHENNSMLYNEWLINRNVLYNVWIEKNWNMPTKVANKMSKYYRCLKDSSNLSSSVFLIRRMNELFRIQNSCQGFTYIRETNGTALYSLVYPFLSQISLCFSVHSESKNPLINMFNQVDKMYESWSGAKKEKFKFRKRINGRSKYYHQTTFHDNSQLWNSITVWNEHDNPYLAKPLPVINFQQAPIIEIISSTTND